MKWDAEKYARADRKQRRKIREDYARELQETVESRLIMDGFNFGSGSRKARISPEYKPMRVPGGVEMDELSVGQLRAALSLGLLTLDVLTQSQVESIAHEGEKRIDPAEATRVLRALRGLAVNAVQDPVLRELRNRQAELLANQADAERFQTLGPKVNAMSSELEQTSTSDLKAEPGSSVEF